MNNDGTMDLENFDVQKVNDINEIKEEIEDCEYEFGIVANGPEYAKILQMCGEELRAQSVMKRWNHFLSKQDELAEIRERAERANILHQEELAELAKLARAEEGYQQNQDDLAMLLDSSISYNNINITEDGITISDPYGALTMVAKEDEEQYLSQIREAVASGKLSLTRAQLNLLESYNTKKTSTMNQ